MKLRKWAMGLLAAGLLTAGLSAGSPREAYAESKQIEVSFSPVHFIFGGEELDPPEGQRAFLYKDSTYVPLRFASYALGKAVDWDPDTYTVTVREPKAEEKASIAAYIEERKAGDRPILPVDASALQPSTIDAYFEKVNYVFGKRTVQPPAELPGIIIEGSLYVPLRFVSESAGNKLEWDGETYAITGVSTAEGAQPYDEIVLEAEQAFQELVSGFTSDFYALKSEYDGADDVGREEVLLQGARKLLEGQETFRSEILETLKAKLKAGNYYEGAVDQLAAQFEDKKQGVINLVTLFTGKDLTPYLEKAEKELEGK